MIANMTGYVALFRFPSNPDIQLRSLYLQHSTGYGDIIQRLKETPADD